MSYAHIGDDEEMYLVPPSSEAMTYVLYVNCYPKWREFYKWRHVENNKGNLPKYTKKDDSTKRFMAVFSNNCSGQEKFGGWSEDGVNLFDDITEQVAKNRKDRKAEILKIDEEVCARLDDAFQAEQLRLAQERGEDVDAIKARKEARRKRKLGKSLKNAPASSRKRKRMVEK